MDSEWGLDFCSLRSWIMSLQACYCASRCPPDYPSYGSTPTPPLSMAVNHLWVIICRRNYSNVFCDHLEFLRRVLRFPSDRSHAVKTIFWRMQTDRYTNRRWAERWADHGKSCSSGLHQLCMCVCFFSTSSSVLVVPRGRRVTFDIQRGTAVLGLPASTSSVPPATMWLYLCVKGKRRRGRQPVTFHLYDGLADENATADCANMSSKAMFFCITVSLSLCSSSFVTSFIYSFWLNWMNNWPQIDRCGCCRPGRCSPVTPVLLRGSDCGFRPASV